MHNTMASEKEKGKVWNEMANEWKWWKSMYATKLQAKEMIEW